VAEHEKTFQAKLEALVAACKQKGIPVNTKILSHGKLDIWVLAGSLWDVTSKVISIAKKDTLSLLKPLLQIKPSLDSYKDIFLNIDYFYPLLVQERFTPTIAQRIFSKIRQLNEVQI
jgi:hypothetical protein